jgi:hypothetical protein
VLVDCTDRDSAVFQADEHLATVTGVTSLETGDVLIRSDEGNEWPTRS